MSKEKDSIITYQGNQISFFSDERSDYVSLTDIFKAWNRYSKSISAWLKTKQTLEFLNVWEKKHNPDYKETQMSLAYKLARERNGLSVQSWIDLTNAKGIFTRKAGTYAHKDIAIRFAGWLSPEFELHLVEEIQRLKELERQKNSYELLNHEQILFLTRLKEVFKYVAHQELIESAHKEVFASKSSSKNPFAEFHKWRNEILDIKPDIINDRIRQYCIDNRIALTKKMLSKSKHEKLLLLDSYETVRNAVWDFLQIKGEVNALNLANLVGDMIRVEKGEVIRNNEDNLFGEKQNLGEYTDFNKQISQMKEVKTARQLLIIRQSETQKIQNPSEFNKNLITALNHNPKDKE